MQTHSRCFLWQLDNLICKFNGTYFIKFITNINNYDHAQLHVFPFPFSMNNASHKLVRSGNKRLILQIDQWSDITEWPSISWVIMSDIYLSHCYSIAWDIYKQLRPRPTTRRRWRLSVCHRSCFRNFEWNLMNFVQSFGVGKLRSSSLGVKIR